MNAEALGIGLEQLQSLKRIVELMKQNSLAQLRNPWLDYFDYLSVKVAAESSGKEKKGAPKRRRASLLKIEGHLGHWPRLDDLIEILPGWFGVDEKLATYISQDLGQLREPIRKRTWGKKYALNSQKLERQRDEEEGGK